MRWVIACVAVIGVAMAGCSKPAGDPLRLEGNTLTVSNQTAKEWTQVEIWLNRYFRATAPSIPAGGRLVAPLDRFVSGYGQRFDVHRIQITQLTLSAKLPDGTPVELKKQFIVGGLAGAMGVKK